jgi:hypothetical protein
MAINAGPSEYWLTNVDSGNYHASKNGVTQSGLVASYDAGALESYPGSGNILYDLTENNYHATLYGNITYNSARGGNLVFPANNTYIKTPEISNFKSICLTVLKTDLNADNYSWKYLWDARPGASGGWFAGVAPNGTPLQFSTGGWGNIYVNGNPVVTATWDNFQTNQYFQIYSVYGGLDLTTYTSTINFMSRYSDSEYMGGNVVAIQIYNRYLTDIEIFKNYYVMKGRLD